MRNKYTLKIKEKVLFEADNIKDLVFYFLSIESNIYYAKAHKHYKIFLNDKVIDVSSGDLHNLEYEYKKELYIKRTDKIKEIIKALGLTVSIETDVKEYGYQPNNIHIYAINENENEIAFSMCYNNKNKITISPYWKRDKLGKYVPMEKLEISFSCDKDLKKIIADINKRFMPKFKELEKLFIEKINSLNNSYNLTHTNMELVKGEKLTEEEKKGNYVYPKCKFIQSAEVYDDSVRLNLYTLTIQRALKVIEALK